MTTCSFCCFFFGAHYHVPHCAGFLYLSERQQCASSLHTNVPPSQRTSASILFLTYCWLGEWAIRAKKLGQKLKQCNENFIVWPCACFTCVLMSELIFGMKRDSQTMNFFYSYFLFTTNDFVNTTFCHPNAF